MKFIAPLLALTAFASSAKAAVTYYDTRTYYSSTIDVGSTYVNLFNIAKFDIPQATLTGITVKVIQSALTGSITVTNTGGVAAAIEGFESDFTARQFTSGLGYAQTTVNLSDVVTTPAWDSVTLQPSVGQTFNIASGQNFAVADQNIASSFWSAYTGSGNVTFSARDVQSITVTGDTFGQVSNVKATTQFAIVYSFSIPEPSSALLGGMAILVLLRRRR